MTNIEKPSYESDTEREYKGKMLSLADEVAREIGESPFDDNGEIKIHLGVVE